MKFYYMIMNDNSLSIITFDKMYSKEGHHPRQRFTDDYEIIFDNSEEGLLDRIVKGGMSLGRIFKKDDRRRLITWLFEGRDE